MSGRNILKHKKVLKCKDINNESNCFITLKDHKERFQNNLSVQLINPVENEIGTLSEFIIQSMNKKLRHKFNLNQWTNTKDVINWFIRINKKQLCKFVIFDIKDFDPSVKESLLKKSLDSEEKYIKVSSQDKAIIKHTRKSLLFNKQQTWIKKESGLFDVMMKQQKQHSLYRDDSGPQAEMRAFVKLGKMFFISLQKFFSFSRKSNFRILEFQIS